VKRKEPFCEQLGELAAGDRRILFVIVELALGALTGFDLALVGAALTVGGGFGLLAGSVNIGMLSAAGQRYFILLSSAVG